MVFGTKSNRANGRQHYKNSFQSRIEALEDRTLMAACSINFDSATGTVDIQGTVNRDAASTEYNYTSVGTRVKIDLNRGTVDVLIADTELEARRAALEAAGGYAFPASQTPWQEIQRGLVGQLETGAILEGADAYQKIAQTRGIPRDNH